MQLMPEDQEKRELDFFSKYLSVWVAICIVLGTAIGYSFPGFADALGGVEIANVSPDCACAPDNDVPCHAEDQF